MNDEYLIEFVRKNPALYDISHPKYPDILHKNSLWDAVADELGVTRQFCKSRWCNIRDNFRKFIKKSESKNVKRYKYSDHLDFLLPVLFKGDGDSAPINYNPSDVEEARDPFDTSQTDIVEKESLPSPNNSLSNSFSSKGASTVLTMKPAAFLPHSSGAFFNPSPKTTQSVDSGGVDAFLSGIAPTLKTLSPYQWHLAKRDIFMIVHKYEDTMLRESNLHELDQ